MQAKQAKQHGWLIAFALVAAPSIAGLTALGCGSASSGVGGGAFGAGAGGGSSGDDGGRSGGTGSGASTGSGGSGSTGSGSASSSGSGDVGDGGPGGSDSSSTPPTPHGISTCLKMGNGDYAAAGPYTVATKAGIDLASSGELPAGDAGPSTFTAFYPSDMSDGCPHPIVSWANGTGVTGSQVYAFFNDNAASWGIVVMAADNPNSAGGSFVGANGGPYNRAGIDYLLKENSDSSSIFYHHLSTRAGVSGHSQGAFAATLATTHPNVEAEVQVEGGGTPKAGIAFLALTGSADNVVGTMPPTMSYASATGPSMFAEYTGADHTTTPTLGGYIQNNPGTLQFMRFYTAWWRCFLGDDQVACAMFKGGSSCGVCKDPNWTSLETKNM
jgi:hypothetical protein